MYIHLEKNTVISLFLDTDTLSRYNSYTMRDRHASTLEKNYDTLNFLLTHGHMSLEVSQCNSTPIVVYNISLHGG